MKYIVIVFFFGLLITLFLIVKNQYIQNKNTTVKIINKKSSFQRKSPYFSRDGTQKVAHYPCPRGNSVYYFVIQMWKNDDHAKEGGISCLY